MIRFQNIDNGEIHRVRDTEQTRAAYLPENGWREIADEPLPTLTEAEKKRAEFRAMDPADRVEMLLNAIAGLRQRVIDLEQRMTAVETAP